MVLAVLLAVASTPFSSFSQTNPMAPATKKKAPTVADLHIAPDLTQRLARFKQVQMPFHNGDFSPREQQMIAKLVDACRYLDDIYWRQADPEGLELYKSLEKTTDPKLVELRRFLWINGSRFDLLDGNQAFVGTEPLPPGRGFYPKGLTRDQVEQYVKDHPEKRAEIYSTTTIVRWNGKDLEGVPYHAAFREFLEPAAKDLREAADLSADAAFANFLRMRADALLTDDYYKSDLAWLESEGSEVRRDLRALRNLSRRLAGREDNVRGVGADPQ